MRWIWTGAMCLCAGMAWAEGGLRGTQGPIPDAVWERMVGVSWHSHLDCPGRDDLAFLQVPFVDFYGDTHLGEMIVATAVAEDVLDIFADIHAAGYPIQSMRLVHEFGGDDGLSMAANNTSAFNCRLVAGTTRMSQHAYGLALDINPVQNPYVNGRRTSPGAGVEYDTPGERGPEVPGVLRDGDAVVRAFEKRGWGWGGHWQSMKDYQHFSSTGR